MRIRVKRSRKTVSINFHIDQEKAFKKLKLNKKPLKTEGGGEIAAIRLINARERERRTRELMKQALLDKHQTRAWLAAGDKSE